MTEYKLLYLGSAILSVFIPDEAPNAWGGNPPEITIMSPARAPEDENGAVTAYIPPASIRVRFWRGTEAEIDSLIETLQTIKTHIAPPVKVDDNPLAF